MRYIPPITTGEFLHLFLKCTPPTGWPYRIGMFLPCFIIPVQILRQAVAVANSGGPDSTCLLFLLGSLIRKASQDDDRLVPQRVKFAIPRRVVSIHVDHQIQENSGEMANLANSIAKRCKALPVTIPIPWSSSPDSIFPRKPPPGVPFEDLARHARSNRLFLAMTMHRAFCIAYAHHADDQVETSVMRFASGTSPFGAMGMRPLRRWGMGDASPLSWNGGIGMQRFVVRPLLEVSKDRILATCDAHRLNYFTDLTNFQPDITLRNRIRHILDNPPPEDPTADVGDSPSMNTNRSPADRSKTQILKAIKQLDPFHDEYRSRDQKEGLRESVRLLGQSIEQIESQVTNFLREHLLESPPATAVISEDSLDTITDPVVRLGLVRRLLRYVSPQRWGSSAAEAGGSSSSLNGIIKNIYDRHREIRPFTRRSTVVWTSVTLGADGSIKFRRPATTEKGAWLVRRQPAMDYRSSRRSNKQDNTSLLSVDVTQRLRDFVRGVDDNDTYDPDFAAYGSSISSIRKSLSQTKRKFKFLWDGRVLVVIDENMIPPYIIDGLQNTTEPDNFCITVELGDNTYQLPRVMLRRKGEQDVVLADVTHRWDTRLMLRKGKLRKGKEAPEKQEDEDPWIRFLYIRTWEAI